MGKVVGTYYELLELQPLHIFTYLSKKEIKN